MESSAENNRHPIPFLTVISNDFDKDLNAMKMILAQLEKRMHVEDAYRFSERAEMAAGWWFYNVYVTQEFLQGLFQMVLSPQERSRKSAEIKLVDMFQDQLRKNGSNARIRLYGDVPFAAPWWSWLMKS
jgi:hypothetical protein